MHFDGKGKVIQRPGNLERGGGGHERYRWRDWNNAPDPLTYLRQCMLQEMQRADDAATATRVPEHYLRQALGVQTVLGHYGDFVASQLHLWSVLHLNLRPAWAIGEAGDLLSHEWNTDRRTEDRAVYREWGLLLAKVLGMTAIPQDNWANAAEEKAWLDDLANNHPDHKKILFGAPLLTADRL